MTRIYGKSESVVVSWDKLKNAIGILICLFLLFSGVESGLASSPRTVADALERLSGEAAKRTDSSELKLEFIYATYSAANRSFDAQFRGGDQIIRGRISADGKVSFQERTEKNTERISSWRNAPILEIKPDLDKLLTEADRRVRDDGYKPTGIALLKFNQRTDGKSATGWLAKTLIFFEVSDEKKARIVEFHNNTFVTHKSGTLLKITLPVVRTPQITKPEIEPLELDIPELRSSAIEAYRTKNNEIIIRLQGDILFAFDDDQPLPDSMPILQQLAKLIIDEKPLQISIEGHTDSWGTPQYNDDLSQRRAGAIAQRLMTLGVSEDNMVVKGYGELYPLAAEINPDGSDNAEGRQRNRRVEVKYRK